jgi:hypothetical protein
MVSTWCPTEPESTLFYLSLALLIEFQHVQLLSISSTGTGLAFACFRTGFGLISLLASIFLNLCNSTHFVDRSAEVCLLLKSECRKNRW